MKTNEEKRIYAVVAEKVSTPTKGEVIQIPGRMAAQAVHAVSRMKMHFLLEKTNHFRKTITAMLEAKKMADESITTIILSCRDTKELLHVVDLLGKAKISTSVFCDHNEEVYGPTTTGIYTALATVPVTKEQVVGILDYLPLAFSDMTKKP